MDKWEYLTFSIGYDKKQKDWVVQYANKPALVGLQFILEEYGSQGWELVNLLPERFQAFPGFGVWNIGPESFRATFKRPV